MYMKDIKKGNPALKIPSFKEFCQKNMSSYNFSRLHEVAEVSKHRITIMLNNPEKMSYAVLLAVSAGLGIKANDLIEEHKCGLDGITVREYRELNS